MEKEYRAVRVVMLGMRSPAMKRWSGFWPRSAMKAPVLPACFRSNQCRSHFSMICLPDGGNKSRTQMALSSFGEMQHVRPHSRRNSS